MEVYRFVEALENTSTIHVKVTYEAFIISTKDWITYRLVYDSKFLNFIPDYENLPIGPEFHETSTADLGL